MNILTVRDMLQNAKTHEDVLAITNAINDFCYCKKHSCPWTEMGDEIGCEICFAVSMGVSEDSFIEEMNQDYLTDKHMD